MATPIRLDQVPARISTNLSVPKQSQGMEFGQRLQAGLQNAGGALATGVGLIGGNIPGGGILSAAVSSVAGMGGGASSASYAATGMVNVGSGSGGINTTVGGGAGPVVGGGGNALGGINFNAGVSQNDVGMGNQGLSGMQNAMSGMLKLQYQMQQENMQYTSISNVMKGKHDTVKNSISNVR